MRRPSTRSFLALNGVLVPSGPSPAAEMLARVLSDVCNLGGGGPDRFPSILFRILLVKVLVCVVISVFLLDLFVKCNPPLK
jgi:hypothetical protein